MKYTCAKILFSSILSVILSVIMFFKKSDPIIKNENESPLKTGVTAKRNINSEKHPQETPAKKILTEFFDATTIHSMKYIGTRPFHEK